MTATFAPDPTLDAPTYAPSRSGSPTRGARPTPQDVESPFGIDELFYSTTDPKGRITSGNEVFVRISGYAFDELVGQPHSVIRHPDVPRTVFGALWTALEAGEPLAAYVKNLSKSGAYYWVLAYVAPAPGGYLSIRIKPTSPVFGVVQGIYTEMVAIERRHEDGTRVGREAGMAASGAHLLGRLAEHGFSDYGRFIHTALVLEAATRDDALATHQSSSRSHVGDLASAELAPRFGAVRDLLDRLVGDAREHTELQATLESRSRAILSIAEQIRLHSLNASLAASRLGDRGVALQAVASLMEERSDAIRGGVSRLDGAFATAIEELQQLAHLAVAGKLQAEMAATLLQEQAARTHDMTDRRPDDDLPLLVRCLVDGLGRLAGSQERLSHQLRAIVTSVGLLERDLGRLRALEVTGRVEQARLGALQQGEDSLFGTIDEQIAAVAREILAVQEASRRLASHDVAAETALREQTDALTAWAASRS